MEHDQRVIIRFLSNERIAADEITTKLQAQFAKHAYKLRTVQFWIGEVRFGRQDLHDEIRTGRPPLDDVNAKSLAILYKSPSKSARSIAERLCISRTTVYNYLHLSIGFKSFHLHWVRHRLIED
jgi:transposase